MKSKVFAFLRLLRKFMPGCQVKDTEYRNTENTVLTMREMEHKKYRDFIFKKSYLKFSNP